MPAERASFFPGLFFVCRTTVRWASSSAKGASQSAVPSSDPSSTTSHSTGQWVGNCCPRHKDQFDCSISRSLCVHTISVMPSKPMGLSPLAGGGVRRVGFPSSGAAALRCKARCSFKSQAILQTAGMAVKAAAPMFHRALMSVAVGVVDLPRPALHSQPHQGLGWIAKGSKVKRLTGGDQCPSHVALGVVCDAQRLLSGQ